MTPNDTKILIRYRKAKLKLYFVLDVERRMFRESTAEKLSLVK